MTNGGNNSLSVYIGNRLDGNFVTTYSISLLAGSTVLNTVSGGWHSLIERPRSGWPTLCAFGKAWGILRFHFSGANPSTGDYLLAAKPLI